MPAVNKQVLDIDVVLSNCRVGQFVSA